MAALHRPLAAALWMTGSIASFSAMAIGTRAIAGRHDVFEILAARSLVGLAVVVAVGVALGRLSVIRRDRVAAHGLRNIVHFSGQALWFWALTVAPLAQVFALEFTSPLWVILFAALFLGEPLTRARIGAALLGIVGIWIIARPDFRAIDPGVAAAAASAVCFALTNVITKAMTKGEATLSILFWLTLMQLGLGTGAALIDGHIAWPTGATLPWLLLIGLAGLCAHWCLTTALSLAPAGFVVTVDFVRLPVIAAIGAAFYAELVPPTLWAGSALILAGILLNLRSSRPQ